jgi:hypothetical protein
LSIRDITQRALRRALDAEIAEVERVTSRIVWCPV